MLPAARDLTLVTCGVGWQQNNGSATPASHGETVRQVGWSLGSENQPGHGQSGCMLRAVLPQWQRGTEAMDSDLSAGIRLEKDHDRHLLMNVQKCFQKGDCLLRRARWRTCWQDGLYSTGSTGPTSGFIHFPSSPSPPVTLVMERDQGLGLRGKSRNNGTEERGKGGGPQQR